MSTLSYLWTTPDLTQIDLEIWYEVDDGGKASFSDPGYEPEIQLTSVVGPSVDVVAGFYAALDSDSELWPHVESECLSDWSASLAYSGD
jgi:hypothetical protein